MGRRTGAWILDRFIAGLLALIPFFLAVITGAVGLNQQAIDQLRQSEEAFQPFADVTVPLIHVNNGPLVLAVVVYIALSAAYYAGSWVMFGATPGQRALGVRVADYATGENLPLGSALVRWGLLEGIAYCISAILLVSFADRIASIPTNEWLGGGSSLTGTTGLASLGSLGLFANLVSGLSSLWLIVLIVSAGTHPARRGIHDRLVGSIVVERVRAVATWPGYPAQAPGYAPQAPGYPPQAWPGYPAQGPGYPPQAWPGYPAQSPGYAPQAPGYPPQAWPGYLPQPAPPTQPAPDAPPASAPPASEPPDPTPGG
jgi:uncharacterized RDD family membrane protein YckC